MCRTSPKPVKGFLFGEKHTNLFPDREEVIYILTNIFIDYNASI